MVSDAMANASLPAFWRESSAKKKKTSRFAKLKQSKLDVRREQWLSQVKSKNDKVDSDGMAESPISSTGDARRKHGLREDLNRRTVEYQNEVLSMHDSESESLMSSSIGDIGSMPFLERSSLGHDCFGKDSIRSGSSSSSSGCCSGSVSEEERDDGCFDDWEAIADALTSDNNPERQTKHEGGNSNYFHPANKNTKMNTLKKASEGTYWSNVNTRAWRPDDASRPRDLPNPSKQHKITSQTGCSMFNGEKIWSWRSVTPQPSSCPICCEDLDLTDSSFLPCPCGFRLCLFCHKRILEEDGRCPGCRRQYETVFSDADFSVAAPKCCATFASIVKIRS